MSFHLIAFTAMLTLYIPVAYSVYTMLLNHECDKSDMLKLVYFIVINLGLTLIAVSAVFKL